METEKICRLCLCVTINEEMQYIYQNFNNVYDFIVKFTSIKLCRNDTLPSNVCLQCTKQIENIFVFKEQCEASDEYLKSCAKNDEHFLPSITEESAVEYVVEMLDEQQKLPQPIPSTPPVEDPESKWTSLNESTNFVQGDDDKVSVKTESITEIVDMIIENELSKDNKDTTDEGSFDDAEDESSHTKRGRPKNSKTKICVSELQQIHHCPDCDQSFSKKILLKRHQMLNHLLDDSAAVEKTHKCPECTKTYSSYVLLWTHMKGHSDKDYVCKVCGKILKRLDAFDEHQRAHAGERPFLCPKCGKGFTKKILLGKHMKVHQNDHLPKPEFTCTICGLKTSHENRMNVHMVTHRDRALDSLPPAGSSSSTIQLGPGRTTATGEQPIEKPHLCSVCGKSFMSTSNLAVHIRRHTGVMTSFCKICGKGYPRSSDLKVHMRRHTGEKPFSCHVCGKSFSRSDKLTIHLRIHTGEKPYVCENCGRAFTQSNDLVSHKKKNLCANQLQKGTQIDNKSPSCAENNIVSKHKYSTYNDAEEIVLAGTDEYIDCEGRDIQSIDQGLMYN